MPFYQSKGNIPPKRHTVFNNPNGGIYYEELVSREGFSYMYSNLYHLNMPTQVMELGDFKKENRYDYIKQDHKPYHFQVSQTHDLLMYNKDVSISSIHIKKSTLSDRNTFYRQGDADILIYIQDGKGLLRTNYGNLEFHEGDYIVVPRGVIFQYDIESDFLSGLMVESKAPIETPSKYRNRVGQLLEHSPFCERDIRVPQLEDPINKKGEFKILVKFKLTTTTTTTTTTT